MIMPLWAFMFSALPQAFERIEWYPCHRIIEEYHRRLKADCNIEKCQFWVTPDNQKRRWTVKLNCWGKGFYFVVL